MSPGHRIDADWHERALLRDGSAVVLRLLRPADKELLAEGFGRLSAESRYRRFFSPKRALSAAELRYLTEVDGRDHLALGAVLAASGQGLGVARFVRLAAEPQVAEPAVAVVDAWQGRGLGALLLRHLTAAARERGVERFRSPVLADNVPMLALARASAPGAVERADDELVWVEMTVAEPAERRSPLERLLALAARARGGRRAA